ncbi:MAG: choice-of-anchor Q domain-containing protein [Bacteroidota bacterium]
MKSKYNLSFLQKLLLILIILPMLSFTVFAQSTRYVNINVIGGNNNGTTWVNAYNNLQTALVAAQSGDQIWVAKGTYLPSADASGATSPSNNRTKTFVMKNGVAIYGGFSGNGTETKLSDRDFKNNVTTLSGDIGTVNVNTDNCYHVVLNNFTQEIPLTNTAILDGFTISGGNANGTYPDFDGGGMYNQYASPILNNLIFTSNNASKNGGGMVNFNSSAPSISNGIFSGNTANTGGAMNNQTSSNAILTNVSFVGNSATTNGGAMYNYNIVSPNLKNIVFSGNYADLGGGMYNEQRASPILINCTFSGNSARTDGGGLYNFNSSNPQIKNSIIWGNGNEITNISSSLPTYTKSVIKTKNLGSGVFAGNTDPLFISQPSFFDAPTTAGDLRLQLCSPIINLGDNTGVTSKDLDGNNRIFENTVDLGAYEFQQNRNPTNVSVSSTLICDKTNINLLATCANGMVTWYNAAINGIVLGTGSSFSYTPLVGVNQTFYASCVINGNCESDRVATSNTLTVNALPVATASAVSPICVGTTLNLNSGNTGISTSNSYAWTGVNSFTSTAQNPNIINATTAATGTYQVIITNDKGCTAMATTSAIVNALPIPTASAVSPICAGTTLNLSSGNTGISTSNSFAWTGVNSFTSTAQNPSILNATTAATGTYQVIITNDKGCTATATTSAIVNALPIPTASAVSPICTGTTLNLSSSNIGISTSNSFAWTGVNSFTSTAQNPSLLNTTTAATGTYQVVITNDKGCTATATTSATINPTPSMPTTQADTQIIFGGSVSLTATGCLSVGSVLKWYQTSDNQLVTMPVSPTVTTQYYAKCEVTANGITCISNNSNNVTVTVLQPLPPDITGATICTGSNIILTATGCSGSTGTFVLKWYQNSNDALVTMPVSPTSNTDYYAKCEQTFNSVTAISSKSNVATVTVLNPLAPVATGSTIYKGNSISLNATGCTGSGFIIKWYEASSNTLVTMPVSPTSNSQYYAKCEQTANAVSCASSKSNYVDVLVIYRIFVDISKMNNSTQDGVSWATALGSLQKGLDQARTAISLGFFPLEVWVAKGLYKPTTTTTRTIYFNMPNNVKVYGGFAGTENALNDRSFRTNTTILSGDIGEVNIASDNSYHVVTFDGSSNTTVLDGFTITGGYSNFDPNKVANTISVTTSLTTTTIETGGGIVVQNAAMPTIANCMIVKNAAVTGGGIYANDSSMPKIIACKIMGNQATFGAGIYFQNGSNGNVNNTLISGNRGIGVVYNNNSNPTINNCTIAGNGGYNGGIFNSYSQPIIKNSILWNNSKPLNDTQSIITYSTIQGGYSGAGNLNYDPQFVSPVTDGLSPTISGDYHLKSSSLVIDRGENTDINLTDKDLDENLRRFNAGTVDMGAYEFQGAATSNIVISAQTGDWEINSTWVGFKIPTLCDVVIIDSNHIITVNTTGVAKSIEYRETGQIKFKTNLAQLNIGCN